MYQAFEQMKMRELMTLALCEAPSTTEDLLKHYPTPNLWADITIEDIQSATGLALERATQLKAILELARRYPEYRAPKPKAIRCAADVAVLLTPDMAHLDREVFKTVLLDTKHHVLHVDTVAVGGLNSCPVHPREVFKEAIKRSAAALILAHNHPSGDPEPSADDIALTKRFTEVGDLIGIKVLDHIVIGRYGFVSLQERGSF